MWGRVDYLTRTIHAKKKKPKTEHTWCPKKWPNMELWTHQQSGFSWAMSVSSAWFELFDVSVYDFVGHTHTHTHTWCPSCELCQKLFISLLLLPHTASYCFVPKKEGVTRWRFTWNKVRFRRNKRGGIGGVVQKSEPSTRPPYVCVCVRATLR